MDDPAERFIPGPRELVGARRVLADFLMHPVRVREVDALSRHFYRVALEGESLSRCRWSPGQKVQVRLADQFVLRTYTPIEWDADRGVMRILGYAHGGGPGSAWLSGAAEGQRLHVVGPRRSLRLRGVTAPTRLFGDETSIGLALAKASANDDETLHVLEVTSAAECRPALSSLGLSSVVLVERAAEDAHLAAAATALLENASASCNFVLSGKASSIRYVVRRLRSAGVERSHIHCRVYWAPGRAGLD